MNWYIVGYFKKIHKNVRNNLDIIKVPCVWHFIEQFTNYSQQVQQYCHVKFMFKFFNKILNKRYFLKIINLYLLVPTNQSGIMWNQFVNKSFTWTQSNIWTSSGDCNISSVVKFQSWWVLKSNIVAKKRHTERNFLL